MHAGCIGTLKASIFFELHVKFEEIYNDAQLKIDLVAERILTLGFTPLHTFTDYLKKFLPSGREKTSRMLRRQLN
jgi:starvation-inducible DNA-binding protein